MSDSQPSLPSAGLVKRFAAMFYDSLLLLGVLMGVNALVLTLNRGEAIQSNWYSLFNLLVVYVFFAWFWTHGGQTLGMRAWRLKAVTNDGQLLSWQQSAVRLALACLSLAAFGLGYLWMYFDAEKRTWHEKMSRTRTLQLEKNQESSGI